VGSPDELASADADAVLVATRSGCAGGLADAALAVAAE